MVNKRGFTKKILGDFSISSLLIDKFNRPRSGQLGSMDEQVIFTTNSTGAVSSIHSFEQANLRQCSTSSRNSAVQVGNKYLFVAQAHKALINVYSLSGSHKRESSEQRLPLPEVVRCLEVVENATCGAAQQGSASHKLAEFNLPYLLLASTESGKLYVWELNSGILLSVKAMAHYQAITKIRSVLGGKYIITSGADARVIIWQTTDLVSMDEPKPVCILHNHTLPVTDFQVSSTYGEFLSLSGTKLYTTSEDATLKCYDLSSLSNRGNAKNSSPSLIATFTFPQAITSLALDPADRACYIGTESGCFSLQFFYKLGRSKIVNLTQLSDGSGSGARIFSLVESSLESNSVQEREKLYSTGQLVCEKLIDVGVNCLETSMDGTLLLIGDTQGKVSITEIFSKQILRTMQPVTTSQAQETVTNILVGTQLTASRSDIITETHAKQTSKLPPLQRVIYDRAKAGQLHEINFQVGEEEDMMPLPVSNFDTYADQLRSQQAVLSQYIGINSTTSTVGFNSSDEKLVIGAEGESEKDLEITALKDNVESLKQAYHELRELHEKLYQEHEKLLKTGN